MTTPRWRAIVLALALITALASCSRSGDEPQTGGDEVDGGAAEPASSESRLASGEFGELGVVCQDGEASGTPDTGVSDTQIRLGVITDESNEFSPGLNEEMFDTAEAFAAWCNEHGGIGGRDLVVDKLDAALFSYADRIAEACNGDYFALVGGGAVFDNADNGARAACGLPSIPGYVVTPEGRTADLQVQPVPNPVGQFPQQIYNRIRELYPDATRFGVMWVELGGVETVHAQLTEAVEDAGFEVAYDRVYAAQNETGWPNFVQEMQEADVQVLELIGEPVNTTNLLQAMQVADWYPEIMTMQPNMYDESFRVEAQDSVGTNTFIRSVYPEFSMADEVPALADYVELMETYNPDGKYPAVLGAQSLSAFLLFARAASECGNELTRQCLIDEAGAVEEWTAGGLHAPTTPGNDQAPACGVIIEFTPEGFQYNEEVTAPDDDSIYNCDPENVLDLEG